MNSRESVKYGYSKRTDMAFHLRWYDLIRLARLILERFIRVRLLLVLRW